MHRKQILSLAAGLAALVLLAAAVYFTRPITIHDGSKTHAVRALAWTAGQALYAAGIPLDALDRVTPALDRPLPLAREVRIERAVRAYLWQDGALRAIGGLAQTPAELLSQAGVKLTEGDVLLWNGIPLALDAQLPSGQVIVLQIQRAHPVRLEMGGTSQQLAAAGPAVIDALWQAGVRVGPGDRLSLPPGSPLGINQVIGYQAARAFTVQSGGTTVEVRSAAENVGQVLAQAGVSLQNLDYSLPAEDQLVPADGKIQVVRVREEIQLDETLMPFESQSAPDPEVELDQRRVTVPGQYGVRVVRERVRYEDGQEVSRVVDSDWIASQPVTQTVGYGTKIVPKTVDTPSGPVEYYRSVQIYATSYSPCRLGTGKCSYTTASGSRLTRGTIAVTRAWYRLFAGNRVYIPGYGFGVISDVGGGIAGRYWIDLGFDEENYQGMTGWMTLYFLTPAPANVPWVLP